jgi:hypothetical protein
MTVSLAFILGTAGTALILAALVLTIRLLGQKLAGRDKDEVDYLPLIMGRWVALVGLVATVVIYVATTWPTFDMEYHSFRPVAGTVAAVESRFLGGSDSTTQNYAVRFDGSDQIYRCDDTRCALLKPGDHLELSCIREWQYASTDGYACRFIASRPAS